ncbi:MAG: hypothetical protein LBD59_09375 [Prevotellaceae bacterium]|jgi:hypothetical protein|nr:hypothetical protein [Prevotellaceae bacterium]
MKTLFYITLLLLIASCSTPESETCHRGITFFNNYYKDTYISSMRSYPDTLYDVTRYYFIVSQAVFTKTLSGHNNRRSISTRRGCAESWFQYGDTIKSCFVFDADVLENESAQTILDNYLVLQRYDLTLDNLIQLNFMLPFPPTEEMKHIRMYPPYGTYNEEK